MKNWRNPECALKLGGRGVRGVITKIKNKKMPLAMYMCGLVWEGPIYLLNF
jgi:hypothetical protein